MPFVNGEELERLRARDQEAERLAHQLAIREPVGRIAIGVQQELETADSRGYVNAEAERIAQIAVFSAERQSMIEELAGELKRTRYDEYADRLREVEGPAIQKQLDEHFQTDGTYASIESKARSDVTAEIHSNVRAQKRAEIDTLLSTDEERQRISEDVREKVEGSEEIARYRKDVRSRLEAGWRAEVTVEVQDTVEREEMADEDAYKAEYAQQVRDTDMMKRKRADVRNRLEQDWRSKTVEEVASAIQDEELQDLLSTRAEREKERLRRESYAHDLVQNFESIGLDVSDVEEGTKISVLLGQLSTLKVKEQYKNSWNEVQTREVSKTGIVCQRKLTFIALGGNRFMVGDDSLHNSASVYERNDALEHGTIVVLGRCVKENGQQKLEHRLAADVPFYFDDDTTSPNIIDAQMSIADVSVNGISARGIEHVQMKTTV